MTWSRGTDQKTIQFGSTITDSDEAWYDDAGVYERLMLASSSEKELEIVRDLSRTYPSHVYYQQRQGPGQRSLFNVLRAYSVYDRQVSPFASKLLVAVLLWRKA